MEPITTAAVISGAAALGAGSLNYAGAHASNRQERKFAREQMAFQKESTGTAMQFQERMSNTAYQRAVADLEAAGLNPLLAYQQGGASSPSGASSGGAMAHSQNELSGGVSSALDAKRAYAEVANLHEQNKKIKADTDLAKSMKMVADADESLKSNSAKAVKFDVEQKRLNAGVSDILLGPAGRIWDKIFNKSNFKLKN